MAQMFHAVRILKGPFPVRFLFHESEVLFNFIFGDTIFLIIRPTPPPPPPPTKKTHTHTRHYHVTLKKTYIWI